MARTPTHPDVEFKRDPDLPGVEARVSRYAERAFRLHTHNEYSIALVESGATTFELHGEPHRGVAGQLVFVDPGAVHACNPDQDSTFAYRLFYIDARWFAEVAIEVFGDAPTRIALAPPVVDDPELFEAWHRLHVVIMEGAEGLEKESALVSNIAATIERYSAEPSAPQRAPAAGEPIAQVAAEVGFADQSHFTRAFREFTGATPRQYQASHAPD